MDTPPGTLICRTDQVYGTAYVQLCRRITAAVARQGKPALPDSTSFVRDGYKSNLRSAPTLSHDTEHESNLHSNLFIPSALEEGLLKNFNLSN